MDRVFPKVQAYLHGDAPSVYDELSAVFPEAVLDVEDSDKLSLFLETPSRDHNSLRMLYKVWRCNQLKRKGEERQGKPYDYVVRFRPDCLPDVKNFLQSRTNTDRLQVPRSSLGDDFVHDIFWLGSSKQDNYLSGLFGRAVLFETQPWRNIHRELADFLSAAPFEFEQSKRIVKHIIDDTTNDEKREITAGMVRELSSPEAVLLDIMPASEDRAQLSELIDMSSDLSVEKLDKFVQRLAAKGRCSALALRGVMTHAIDLARDVKPETRARALKLVSMLLGKEAGQDDDAIASSQIRSILEKYLGETAKTAKIDKSATSEWLDRLCDRVEGAEVSG